MGPLGKGKGPKQSSSAHRKEGKTKRSEWCMFSQPEKDLMFLKGTCLTCLLVVLELSRAFLVTRFEI